MNLIGRFVLGLVKLALVTDFTDGICPNTQVAFNINA